MSCLAARYITAEELLSKKSKREKKMKTMNDNSNGSNNNWLGFSLSSHMKMEVATHPQHHHHQYHHHSQASPAAAAASSVSNAVPTSFYLSSHLNGSGICYGVGESGGFHAPLSVMPLKSDGSLCIMEALSRSQSEGLLQLLFFFACFPFYPFGIILFPFFMESSLHF